MIENFFGKLFPCAEWQWQGRIRRTLSGYQTNKFPSNINTQLSERKLADGPIGERRGRKSPEVSKKREISMFHLINYFGE